MKDVAITLQISPHMAETHKYEIMQALGAETTEDPIRHAIRIEFVSE